MSVLDTLAGGAVVDPTPRGRVLVRGADARSFLHRMSTQHVKDLAKGEGRLNALLTDKGRFVDLVIHLDRGDDGVLLVTSPGRGPVVTAWLDRYLFTEKVELTDLGETGGAADVAGAGAGALVDKVIPGASALAPWAFAERDGRIVARDFDRVTSSGARVPAYVVIDLARQDVVEAYGLGAPAAADDSELARVVAGVPGVLEITGAFTPLDLGMHDAIHWAKGCYIGQEVIARLDTYQKQHKRLLLLKRASTSAASIAPGAQVLVNGAVAGAVTSSWGPWALAVAKVPEDGPVQVKLADGVVDAVAGPPPTAQSAHD